MEAPLQNYVNEVARSSTSSVIGAQWLSSYIDPAHGNAYVFPDEDTNYSAAIRTKNIQAINRDTFVASNYSGQIPSILNFMVFSTPSPDTPILIYGKFYYQGSDGQATSEYRFVYLNDLQYNDYNGDILQSRLLYKGFTLSYTGNAFQNQGFMSATTYAPSFSEGRMYNQEVLGDSEKDTHYNPVYQKYMDVQYLPTSSRAVANVNRDFEIFATSEGVYGVHKFLGARSEYCDMSDSAASGNGKLMYYFGSDTSTSQPAISKAKFYSYSQRFSIATLTTELNGKNYVRLNCLNNWNVICVAVDGMSADQSLLLKYYQGSQVHFKPNSSLVAMQTYKGFLDNAALTAASQLNASLACVYRSSYNDFRAIWSKIRSFLKSSNGRNLVGAITSAVGPYGSLINAAYGLL